MIKSQIKRVMNMNILFRIIPPPIKSVIPFFFLLCFVSIETYGQIDNCDTSTTGFNDPLYGCQWHLKNTGQLGAVTTSGEDINVEGVWDNGTLGAGINVAVVDDGMQTGHADLTDNVNTRLNHNYSGSGNVYDPSKARGTRVSGVIAAAGDNSLGVRGVAPQASIYAYNLAGNFSGTNAKDAMVRNRDITAVSVNNWGPDDTAVLIEASSEWEEGVRTGIREGFGGKGVFYVWAAGDGYEGSDQANLDEYSNYYAVTAVCSVDGEGNKSSFSEEGVNLWVCAPGEDITTTDNNDGYIYDASGTAYSAAQVAGVAALMREVNGDLGWRDIKLILAASARKNDASDTGWETGAHKYGSDTESYNYNTKYGFGVTDADAAAGLAGSWTTVPLMRTLTASSGSIDTAIPDRDNENRVDGEVTDRLTIPDTSLFFTEFVEVELNFSHTFLPELEIQITSPDGTVSKFTEEYVTAAFKIIDDTSLIMDDFSYTNKTYRFGSARHLGEAPSGEWVLKISDTSPDDTGTLHSWSINVYGHKAVEGTAPGFEGETIDNKNYVTGRAITPETLPLAAGGEGILTYSLSPRLPAGLTFRSADRTLSGTPTAASSGRYMYAATDEDGDKDELSFTIRVRTPAGRTSGTDAGGGGCVLSDQNEAISDLSGAVASLMLIPVSVAIRRRIRSLG